MLSFHLVALFGAALLTQTHGLNVNQDDVNQDDVTANYAQVTNRAFIPPEGKGGPSAVITVTVAPNPTADCAIRDSAFKNPLADTAESFLKSNTFSAPAKTANPPRNYTQVFTNLHSSSAGPGFLATHQLGIYNPMACAAKCDAEPDCLAFNIFFERNPMRYLAKQCPDAPSVTLIKCALWAERLSEKGATNHGYNDFYFTVAIAGSNGYNKGVKKASQGYDEPSQRER
ncbi:hypothetical protein BCR34DRAFT_602547 [Clohesyomyces aquaticus]|uniref:Apple domain-containing protein n=1 Tax=Clohesyomyces aquaticus TaxID=1231657 RepID=A0A1Y1ZHZ7_9PLEO|nr:hypothetical protein BCR34DRAFT_602547 [Clohesyomyces aquaticus]